MSETWALYSWSALLYQLLGLFPSRLVIHIPALSGVFVVLEPLAALEKHPYI